MGLSAKMQISVAVKHTFCGGKIVHGERNWGYRKRSISFSSTLNAHEIIGAHSYMVISCLSHLIVNTAAGCYSRGQALVLNAYISTCLCTMFWQRKKCECPESFESERFTIAAA